MSFITSPGVVGFSNLQNTTFPNNVIPVSYFLGSNASFVNIDVAFAPKGTGAVLASIPDGTAAGGDKRGGNAVDLQSVRTNTSQVASGSHAVIGGGFGNTASGNTATISGGQQNLASALYASVCGGVTNTASAQGAIVLGGESNTANGADSIVAGTLATARSISGAFTVGCGVSATLGQLQSGQYLLGVQTTNAVATTLRTNNLVAQATNQIVLPNNSIYKFTLEVSGFDIGNGDYRVSTFTGIVARAANAASTTVPVGTVETVIGNSAGAAAWTVVVSADVVNGGLAVSVTGAVGRNINWLCKASTVEVGV
jgi:hypothetical protein